MAIISFLIIAFVVFMLVRYVKPRKRSLCQKGRGCRQSGPCWAKRN